MIKNAQMSASTKAVEPVPNKWGAKEDSRVRRSSTIKSYY